MQRKLLYGEKVMVVELEFKDGFLVSLHNNEHYTNIEHKGDFKLLIYSSLRFSP